jgi:cytochrome bd-type quinol oxidase subunit 2
MLLNACIMFKLHVVIVVVYAVIFGTSLGVCSVRARTAQNEVISRVSIRVIKIWRG